MRSLVLIVILSALIEWIRIKNWTGLNISKVWTVVIAAALFVVPAIWADNLLVYAAKYAAIRGVLYSPVLNLLRGLPIDYVSKTTNSKLDKIERQFGGFWVWRGIYLIFVGVFFISTR